MVKVTRIGISALILLLGACLEEVEKPLYYDGSLSLSLYVEYEGKCMPCVPVTIEATGLPFAEQTNITDSTGVVHFTDLAWDRYQVRAEATVMCPSPADSSKLDTLSVVISESIYPEEKNVIDTLHFLVSGSQPGLKINEFYTGGPPNNIYFFFDQYFELYNSSNDTVYLDGMVFCRMGYMLENITYIFQFPGEPLVGREYPVPPKEFVVLAQDAYDHTQTIAASVDLSNADWEFRNSVDYADYDNPDVPNIDNIEVGHRLDFMVGLTGDVILIADGSDVDYLDGMDIESVIDCVEYSSYSKHQKEIESELDRGFCGLEFIKYSGQSQERIAPGYDTNNSTLDFEIINAPTPGYQH